VFELLAARMLNRCPRLQTYISALVNSFLSGTYWFYKHAAKSVQPTAAFCLNFRFHGLQ
jgi:hypothetical protein